MKISIVGLLKGSGKRSKVSEKSGNLDMDIEWQPCMTLNKEKGGETETCWGIFCYG